MEAASLGVMMKRHGYRILICLDFYTLRCGLNRRLRQFGKSRVVILDSLPLCEGAGNPLIGFSQFSFSSLLKFHIISDGLRLFFILNDAIMQTGEFLCAKLAEDHHGSDGALKNAGAIKRGFSDFHFAVDRRRFHIKNEAFLSFSSSILPTKN